jgi:hypothetical protein
LEFLVEIRRRRGNRQASDGRTIAKKQVAINQKVLENKTKK